MFADASQERSRDGSSQSRGKDVARPGHKAKKKTHSPKVTLPPLCPEPFRVLSASAAKPLFSCSSLLKNVPSDGRLSLAELPHVIAKVGPGIAIGDTKWKEGPRLMASTLGTEIPVRITQSTTQSIEEKSESKTAKACKDKKIATLKHGRATKPSMSPLTGAEVVQTLFQKRDLGEYEIYYLKTVDGDAYRPYDLRVVHSSEAGPEHYIFTPKTVLHVTQTGIGGTVSLAEWYRQYVLWTDLQKIAFFRDFRLQKAFFWWHQNTRKRIFQRRSKNLEDMMLIAVPQFRNALHLLKGVIEELKETHWMPLDVCEGYTLIEFKNILISKNQECLQILEKLSQYHTLILHMVKEDSYKKHQELQLHLKLANDPKSFHKPMHLLMAHQRKLKKELAQSESTLKKLGNFAALVHQMIVQSLVTVILEDAISFLDLLKRKELTKCSLFHTELRFSADNRLTVEPPIHLFKEAVSQALLTVGESIIQVFLLLLGNSNLQLLQQIFYKIGSGDWQGPSIILMYFSLATSVLSWWYVLGHCYAEMTHLQCSDCGKEVLIQDLQYIAQSVLPSMWGSHPAPKQANKNSPKYYVFTCVLDSGDSLDYRQHFSFSKHKDLDFGFI